MQNAKFLRNALWFGVLLAVPLAAQVPKDDPLFKTISSLDTALFDAFNKCDLAKFGSLLTEGLEFYHDNDGLSVGRQTTVDAVKRNICGKVRRELAADSLQVFPLSTYGAIETGIHFFCETKNAKCPDGSGVGRFFHIWENKNGEWKVTRIVSYDHCNNCSTSTGPDYRRKTK